MRRAAAALSLTLLAVCTSIAVAVTPAAGRSGTVFVPKVEGQSAVGAYALLHAAGLKVSIPAGVRTYTEVFPSVADVAPAQGAVVRRGATVTLTLTIGCASCGIGSPAVPLTLPAYRVPRFVGRPASAAATWVRGKVLSLTVTLGPLRAGAATSLYANYRVTGQSPRPGARLRLGIGHRTATGGSFMPTPLAIRGTQFRG